MTIPFEFSVAVAVLAVAIFALAAAILAYPGPKRTPSEAR